MSSDQLKMIKIVEDTLEKKLKEIVAIFKMNQPTETSRVVSLIKKELIPVFDHLKQQDIVLNEIKEEQKRLKEETLPAIVAERTIKSTGGFIIWLGSIGAVISAMLYGLYKIAKAIKL